MEPGEAVALLRATARAKNVKHLVNTSNGQLEKYCSRMKNNPGYIKWFVAAVSVGRRPEEVLARPEMFLDYCMANVYGFLSDPAKRVLCSLLAVPGPKSHGELSFLNDFEADVLQPALHELVSSSMVTMESRPSGSSFETRYELGGLARDYLTRSHPPNSDLVNLFVQRKNQLVATREELQATQTGTPYLPTTIATRSPGDLIAAKHLLDALTAARMHKFGEAYDRIEKAKRIAPGYFEVHRVEGWVAGEEGNVGRAVTAYEAAVELEPSSAPLRMFFAGFLMRRLDDPIRALDELLVAERIDPTAVEIKVEAIRACLYSRRYDEARTRLHAIGMNNGALSERSQRIVFDLQLQYYQRMADSCAAAGEYRKALEALRELQATYLGIPTYLRDARMRTKLDKAIPTAVRCISQFDWLGVVDDRRQASSVLDWLRAEVATGSVVQLSDLTIGLTYEGAIVERPADQNFLYVSLDVGPRVFCHRSAFADATQWQFAHIGDRVLVELGTREQDGAIIATTVLRDETGDFTGGDAELIGQIIGLPPGESYGFVQADDGPRLFFHRSSLRKPTTWNELSVGSRVVFRTGRAADGRRAAIDIAIAST